MLRIVSHVGPGLEEAPPESAVAPGHLMSGKSFEAGATLVVNDVRTYADATPDWVAQGMKSGASLILKSGARLIGTVVLNSSRLDHFTPERVKFLTAIVDGMGALLENARLLEGVRESEERYRNLFEQSRDAIFVISEDGEELTGVNQAALDLFGFTTEEAIGSGFADRFVDPADQVRLAREIDEAGYVRDFEVRLRKTDGSEIICLTTFAPRLDGEGRSLGFQGVIRDVTEHVKAEEAERLRTQELQALFTVASTLVGPGDIEQKVTQVLQEIARAVEADWVTLRLFDEEDEVLRLVSSVGIGLEDLPPEPVLQLGQLLSGQAFLRAEPQVVNDYPSLPTADPGRVAQGMKSAVSLILKTGDRLVGTVQVASKNLNYFNPQGVKFLTAIVDGMGVHLDNARLLEDVRDSEGRYRNLFEESRDAIFVSAPDGEVVAANQASLELFGFELQDAIGSDVGDRFVHSADRERFRQAIGEVGSVRDFEVRLRKKDGTEIDCLLTAARSQDEQGRGLSVQGVIRDVTERKKAEATLLEQTRDLAVLGERNRMAREIHDTLAQGFTGIVLQLEAGEQALEESPTEASDHLGRAKNLARESLQEARRSVWNLLPRSLEHRSLSEALNEEIRSLLDATNGDGARLNVRGPERELSAEVQTALLRICQESLTNIRKHANANEVSVDLEFHTDAVLLSVRDDGTGFDVASPETSGQLGGFGLTGMEQRARLLRGTLSVSSSKDQGTRVEARIPTS